MSVQWLCSLMLRHSPASFRHPAIPTFTCTCFPFLFNLTYCPVFWMNCRFRKFSLDWLSMLVFPLCVFSAQVLPACVGCGNIVSADQYFHKSNLFKSNPAPSSRSIGGVWFVMCWCTTKGFGWSGLFLGQRKPCSSLCNLNLLSFKNTLPLQHFHQKFNWVYNEREGTANRPVGKRRLHCHLNFSVKSSALIGLLAIDEVWQILFLVNWAFISAPSWHQSHFFRFPLPPRFCNAHSVFFLQITECHFPSRLGFAGVHHWIFEGWCSHKGAFTAGFIQWRWAGAYFTNCRCHVYASQALFLR